jgi:tRNA(Ile)-lysidine synthase
MAASWRERGIAWGRPLLPLGREELRAFLRRQGRAWIEDPSNEDRSFARVRARDALSGLAGLGITAAKLSEAAGHLREARWALERFAELAAERLVTIRSGDVVISYGDPLWRPTEIEFRLWTAAIRWISGAPYRPRRQAVVEAQARSWLANRRSLGGTLIRFRGEGRSRELVIGREPRAAARAAPVPTTSLWDGRWRLSGPHAPDLEVRMLGAEGLALCPDWRGAGLERSSVLASPAVWRGSDLVAAPLAGRPEGWTAEAVPDFHAVLRGEV